MTAEQHELIGQVMNIMGIASMVIKDDEHEGVWCTYTHERFAQEFAFSESGQKVQQMALMPRAAM